MRVGDDTARIGSHPARCDIAALRGAVVAAVIGVMTTGMAVAVGTAARLRGSVRRSKDCDEAERADAGKEGVH